MKEIIQKFKKTAIIAIIIFIILAFLIFPGIALSMLSMKTSPILPTSTNSINDLYYFITHPISSFGMLFSKTAALPFYFLLLKIGIIFDIAIWFFLSIKTNVSKEDYTDIEQGSSRWCKPGEQYKILSKTEGILLAKDNYLPIDKIGNVNVTVVGRKWFTENPQHLESQMY